MPMSTWYAIGMVCTFIAGYLLACEMHNRFAGSCNRARSADNFVRKD
jgi:prolipoprotein diacylglyceryltransferase